MQISNQDAERLVREGVEALRRARPAEARDCFEKVAATGRANAQVWLLLAMACRSQGDPAGEEKAVDQLLALEPRLVRGHIMKADRRAAAGDDRAALGFYESALRLAATQQVPAEVADELKRAEAWVKRFAEEIDVKREASLSARGWPREKRSPRFQQSLDILAGRRQIFVQQPTGYYFPELPQIQFFDPGRFAWVSEVEAAAEDIAAELTNLLPRSRNSFRPYLQSDANRPRLDDNHLLDSSDWSALFLSENGKRNDDIIADCPRTWAALQAAPLPYMVNSPTVMFSLLRPGARIAPHTGTHNARLICHLPLVVPPNCGFRVGNETREWEVGKLLIFDDTIEHEAWNDSAEERIVLIFDIWRPELSDQERAEVDALFRGPALEHLGS
jgi:aspartyl/asparaginyl beta-hydroxylase (cupin superfamily)